MKRSTGFCTARLPASEEKQRIDFAALPAAGLLSAAAVLLLGAPLWAAVCVPLCAALLAAERLRRLPLLVLCATAVFCAVFCRQVGAGLLQFVNSLLTRLTTLTGRIYLPFETAQAPSGGWFFAPLSLLLSLAACRCIRRGSVVFCAVGWLVFAPCCALGLFAPDGLPLLAAGTAALVLYREKARSWKALALAALCAVLLAPSALLQLPESTLPQRAERAIHRLRFDGAAASMPEGQLDDLPPRGGSDVPALKITMQTPQKLYLRGFLGERYTGTGWTALDNLSLADESDSFYWLHQDGFFAQSSIASASEAIGTTSASTLTVTNLAACAGQQYLPYALVGNDVLSADIIGDNRTEGTRKTVTLQYLPGSVPQWYDLQAALADAQSTPTVESYLESEQQYRDFCYAHYLSLTPEAAQSASALLDGHLSGRTLPEIRSAILDALDESLTYDETVRTRCGTTDFLSYLLTSGGRGYDVHYATAAVLLLRYCGVPARYVEGYYLPADEAAQAVTLTEQYAHAWPEYYLDGVGWIPFEVTPGYLDNEESTLTAVSEKQYENTQLPPPVQQPQNHKTPRQTTHSAWPLAVFLGLLLSAAVLRTLLRRRRLKKRLAALNSASPREAAAGWYGYAVYLQERTGLTLLDADAQSINREALFSRHEITPEQAAKMSEYADSVRKLCRTRHWWQRFADRWLRCIY